jgi:hypothetical protein
MGSLPVRTDDTSAPPTNVAALTGRERRELIALQQRFAWLQAAKDLLKKHPNESMRWLADKVARKFGDQRKFETIRNFLSGIYPPKKKMGKAD